MQRVFSVLLIAAALLTGIADAQSPAQARAAVQQQLSAILGTQTARVQSIAQDAQGQLGLVLRQVSAQDGSPRSILTRRQKMELARAMRNGEQPEIDLSEAQRASIERFARDAADAALPIIRLHGAAVDRMLTREQQAQIVALRERVAAAFDDGPFAPIRDRIVQIGALSPGAFAVLAYVDVRSLM